MDWTVLNYEYKAYDVKHVTVCMPLSRQAEGWSELR